MQGKIMKGVGGFYYVHLHNDIDNDVVYECKARGVFRNQNIKPSVGDNVEIDIVDKETFTGNITAVCERSNVLIRPAVTNVDQAVIIFALTQPKPNFNLLDRFLIMMSNQDVDTVICLNKADISRDDMGTLAARAYEAAGYQVIISSVYEKRGLDELWEVIHGKTTVLAGPSGVGKSSILNQLKPDAGAATGKISDKIKRGKHTTRHSELMCVDACTYIMDTPGFSSLYVENMAAEDLKNYYKEFDDYSTGCRFNGCLHIHEPECGVKSALQEGTLSRLRYENYVNLYNEIKDRRKW
ncbi:MAG: ribosome small subunit-dependent GTPase A [Clostridium sp.]|nr:ribosome small subunit-dependent GTPase A [Clostridium sp.]MCM1398213.1 ribosome small subunit-dependent GTPase A [Clostridium sp.]MCM1460373.1 ribosome small subunit-dependent GTPase A [Bacteroides sp.]